MLISAFKSHDDLLHSKGVELSIIRREEERLGIRFAKDYTEYLRTYGIAAYAGHELTGITKSKRLNVVDVTNKIKKELDLNNNMYVIEDTNINCIIIWQSEDGAIYKTVGNSDSLKICDSLAEYINKY